MRRHAVCTMYNNFIYRYKFFFLKNMSWKRTCKENKKFILRVISHYDKKRMVGNISGDWKDKLENFSKRIQEEENMT